jgi:hypothetical protein
MKKNIWQSIIGILIGALFLFLTLRDKPINEIFINIKDANPYWIIANGLLLLWVFWLRAMRWKVLLENVNYKPKRKDIFYAIIMAYFVNSFTPKLGEIARCTSIKKSSNIPLTNGFGTVVSERIWDLLILLAGILILFILEINRLGNILQSMWLFIAEFFTNNILLALVAGLIIFLSMVTLWVLFKKSKIQIKIVILLKEIFQTVKVTFKLKKARKFLFLTSLIWTALILMNYTCLKSLPDTNNYSIYFAVIVLFIGGLGWAIPSPGGIGTTHFIILQLFIAFELSQNAGIAFGILSNGLTFIFTLSMGLVALILNVFYKIKMK